CSARRCSSLIKSLTKREGPSQLFTFFYRKTTVKTIGMSLVGAGITIFKLQKPSFARFYGFLQAGEAGSSSPLHVIQVKKTSYQPLATPGHTTLTTFGIRRPGIVMCRVLLGFTVVNNLKRFRVDQRYPHQLANSL